MTARLDDDRTDRLLSAAPLHIRDVVALSTGQQAVLADWHESKAREAAQAAKALRDLWTLLRPWLASSDSSFGPALTRARDYLAANPTASDYVLTRIAEAERVAVEHPELLQSP